MSVNLSHTPQKSYDICVITAANEYQAEGYREQIKWRRDRDALPDETEFIVIADPEGKRIGSGGSTIYVLYQLLRHFLQSDGNKAYNAPEEIFKYKRILILHSGGDSRRLPAYSAVGKIFVPLPTNTSPLKNSDDTLTDITVTVFDLLLDILMKLPCLKDGQIIVASGDVLLNFDAVSVRFSDSGLTGLAYPGSVEIAKNHGVYISDLSGKGCGQVVDFLQKPTYAELKKYNALDLADRAFVDTGVMNFSVNAVKILMDSFGFKIQNGQVIINKSLYKKLFESEIQLDLYSHIPFAILGKSIQNHPQESLAPLRNIPFFVNILPYCEFLHIGTSKSLIQSFHTFNNTASVYGFQNHNRTNTEDVIEVENVFAYNSLIASSAIASKGLSIIEGSYIGGEFQLAGENILTNIPEEAEEMNLDRGICIACVPIKFESNIYDHDSFGSEEWVSIIYGIQDDFKKDAEDNSATYLNRLFHQWIRDNHIDLTDLWENGKKPHELWTARLFPVSSSVKDSINLSLALQNNNGLIEKWRQATRLSLSDILQRVDYKRLMENHTEICRKINRANLKTLLINKSDLIPSRRILSWCVDIYDYIEASEAVLKLINRSEDMLFQSRMYKLLSVILQESGNRGIRIENFQPASEYEDKAFSLIREYISQGLVHKYKPMKIQIRPDEVIWVCAPVRLDFAGGWSDTPPYCLERGGSVLNAAVKLNGQYPIQVIGKLHPEPIIRINSVDLGKNTEISETWEIMSYQDPTDWSALPKAAFIAAGVLPQDKSANLRDILAKLGAGIDLTLFSAVPAGSGLGTSSILGSAVITCLSRMLGQERSKQEIFNLTLYMEQLMTTGGGWQDQIGGLIGGVKYIQTGPGINQIPRISWTTLGNSKDICHSDRLLLYYTGIQRIAKNILREIVSKYMDREPMTLDIINQLQNKSYEMKDHLDHRDMDTFGKGIGKVWQLNKALDPGTTNKHIEGILAKINHLISGAKLLGAGGGGFLFIVSKGSSETRKIKEILTEEPPNNKARFFEFHVDDEGLAVNVL
jgi:galactokinase/mevalonate kinase-like predicted kinase